MFIYYLLAIYFFSSYHACVFVIPGSILVFLYIHVEKASVTTGQLAKMDSHATFLATHNHF